MSLFPADDKGRKMLPVFKMITGYFPKALREVTRVCVANNVRYSPDREPADITWNRGKSRDQLGSLFRHLMERTVDNRVWEHTSPEVTKTTGITRVYVLAEAAWRALAALEVEIEQQERMPEQPGNSGIVSREPAGLPVDSGHWAEPHERRTDGLNYPVSDGWEGY